MASVVMSAPVIGIACVDRFRVRVQVRPGSGAAWLTLLGRTELESFTIGTISGLDSGSPRLRVFQRLQNWATPTIQRELLDAVVAVYRNHKYALAGGSDPPR